MPSKNDPEIKKLLTAIELGLLSPQATSNQCIEAVEELRAKCERSPLEKKRFQTWWCKEKQKINAVTHLEPVPTPPRVETNPPVPPAAKEPAVPEAPIAEKDRPGRKKGPKKDYPNHPRPEPAPSPPPTDPTPEPQAHFDFSAVDWSKIPESEERNTQCNPEEFYSFLFPKKPASKPVPSPKPSPKNKEPSKPAPTKPAPTKPAPIMTSDTPEELALKIIDSLPDPPARFSLDDPHCAVEWYKVPWVDSNNIMHITYVVRGATKAEIEDGGKSIQVTFPRGEDTRFIVAVMRELFQAKLTNPKIQSSFDSFERMMQYLLEKTTQRATVSLLSS